MAGYFSVEAGNQFVGSTPKRYIDARSTFGYANFARYMSIKQAVHFGLIS